MNKVLGNDRLFNIGNDVAVDAKHKAAATMAANGLDWSVTKRMVQYSADDGVKSFPGQYVLTRNDNQSPLSIVGKDYHAIQNIDSFDMFDNLTFIGGFAEYVRAGCTRGGQKIFIEAKLTIPIREQNGSSIK